MRKLSVYMAVFTALLGISVHATDFSIGTVIGGFGPTAVRGNDYIGFLEKKAYSTFVGFPYSMSFSPIIDVRGQIDVLQYLSLEFGVGYAQRSMGFLEDTTGTDKLITKYTFPSITIPFVAKAQFPINTYITFYTGLGARLNFNLMVNIDTYKNDSKEDSRKYDQQYNAVDLDLSLLLGFEYTIAQTHFVGLRLGYDFNLIGSFVSEDHDIQKIFIDSLAISLTYRYMLSDKKQNANPEFVFQR